MKKTQFEASSGGYSLVMLLIAAIWGFAFVAQRLGMEHLDAFSFNAIRFALGALLLRLVFFKSFRRISPFPYQLGVVLFLASAFQQLGIVYTTAANAGFITGLYVLFVPLIGLYKGKKPRRVCGFPCFWRFWAYI